MLNESQDRALTVQERDEHRLVPTASGNKRAVEARLTNKAEELGLKSRDPVKKTNTLAIASPERMTLEYEIEDLHMWLKSAPTG